MLSRLFLNPPGYEGFHGGARARYQVRREIRSYWYPTWPVRLRLPGPGLTVHETLETK